MKNAKSLSIKRLVNCTKKVINKRSKIQESSLLKSGISLTADLSIDLFTSKSYSIESFDIFIEHEVMTFALTNMFFVMYDCIHEFTQCAEDVCEIE